MKKTLNILLKIILPILLGIAVFWILFDYIKLNSVFEIIKTGNLWALAGYLFVSLLLIACAIWRWSVILKSRKHKVKIIYLIKSFFAGYGVSYITPSAKLGGEPVRAALLKRYGLKFHEALSSIIIDKTLDFIGSGLFFIVGGILLIFKFSIPKDLKFTIIIISAILILLIGIYVQSVIREKKIIYSIFKFFRLNKMKKVKLMMEKIIQTEEIIIKFYKKDKKSFYIAILIMMLTWILMIIEYKLALLIFGYNANIFQTFLIVSLVGAAYMIPVPLAIGTLEGGQVALAKSIGINPALGLGIGLLTRVRDSIWAIIGLIIATYYGVVNKKKK